MRQRLRAQTLISISMLLLLGCAEQRPVVDAADVYQRACATCHGGKGTGGLPQSEGAPPPRDFTEAAWQASKSDEELIGIVARGKGAMPSFADVLTASEIASAVRQIRLFGASAASSTGATGGAR